MEQRPNKNQHEGISLARRAIQVTGDDPSVLAWSAYVLAYFGEDIDAAIQLIDRALAELRLWLALERVA